jgi:O-antigen/teichoic acid export membrane protein
MASDLMLRAGKAAAWVAVSKWFDLIGAMVTLAVTARLLSPDEFGVFGMAMLATLIPEVVLGGSLADGVIQRKDLRPGHMNGVFWMHVVLFAVFMAGLWVMTPLVVAQFKQPDLAMIVPVVAASSLFWALSTVPGALLRRELRFGAICIADTASTAAALIFGIGLALMGFGVWSLVWSEIARRFTKCVALWIASRWMPTFAFTRADVSDLLRFNVLALVTQIIQQIETAVPKFFVGMFLGAQALGYFNMAVRFYQQLTQVLLAPFSSVALPVVASVQHDRERLHATFAAGTKAATMLAFPAFIGAAAVAPVAIPLIFGEQWIPAVPAAQILTLAAVRAPVNVFNGEVLRGTGKPGIYTALASLGALLLIIFVPMLTAYGIAMVSLTVLARGLLQWFLAAFIVQRTLGYPLIRQFTIGWQSFFAAAGMGLAVTVAIPWLEMLPRTATLAILIVIGLVVHMALLAILAPKLAQRLVNLGKALVQRDRKGLSRVLGLS